MFTIIILQEDIIQNVSEHLKNNTVTTYCNNMYLQIYISSIRPCSSVG